MHVRYPLSEGENTMYFSQPHALVRFICMFCLCIALNTFLPFFSDSARAAQLENPSVSSAVHVLEQEAQEAFDAQYYTKAEKIYDQLLQIYEAQKSPSDIEIFATKRKKILCARGNGDYKGTLPLLESLVKEMENALGAQHLETLYAKREKAESLWLLGRYVDAMDTLKDTKKGDFSTKEEKTQNTLAMLTQLYKITASLGESSAKMNDVFINNSRILGQRHIYTLQSQLYTGQDFLDFGESEKALVVLQDALSKAIVTFPATHPLVLELKLYIARCYLALQQYSQTTALLKEIIELQKKLFSPNHPELLRSQQVWAELLLAQKEWEQADILLRDIIAKQKELLGIKHVNTIQALNSIATLYIIKKNFAGAKKMALSLIGTAKLIGNKNPIFVSVFKNYITAALEDGDIMLAFTALKAYLLVQEKKYGPEHPFVLASQKQIQDLRKKHAHTDFDREMSKELKRMSKEVNDLLEKKKYRDALALCETLYSELRKLYDENDVRVLSVAIQLGNIYFNVNYLEKAQDIFTKILPQVMEQFGYGSMKLLTVTQNLQSILANTGNRVTSLAQMKTLYETLTQSLGPDHSLTLVTAMQLGISYATIPDYVNAQHILEKNLPLLEKLFGKDSSFVNKANTVLAYIYKEQGQTEKEQAILRKSSDIEVLEVKGVSSRAMVLYKSGKAQEAQKILAEELSKKEKAVGAFHTDSLKLKAHAALMMPLEDDFVNYADSFARYYVHCLTRQDLYGPNARLFPNRLGVYAGKENLNLLTFYIKLSLINQYNIRTQNVGGLRESQQIILNKAKDTFRDTSGVLMGLGRYKESFLALSLFKAMELDDAAFNLVSQDFNSEDFFTKAEYSIYSQLEDIAAKAKTIGDELFPLELRLEKLSDEERAHWTHLHSELENLSSALKELLFTQTPVQLEKQNSYDYLSTGAKNVQEMQDILTSMGGDALFVHTAIGENALYIYLTAPNAFLTKATKISEKELQEIIVQFRSQLGNPKSDPRPLALELYKIILEPVIKDIEALNPKTLIFSLDGILRYIPMSTLYDGEKWLVEKYNIALFNEAARKQLQKNTKQVPFVAAMGVTHALQGFSALPAVRKEIDGIVKEGKTGILQGVKYMNDRFNRSALNDTLHKDVPFVHVASHFQFDPVEQKNSFLLLGTGEKLTLSELFGKNSVYSFEDVQLLTLSACDTASGLQKGDGREVESFGALAQQHGAKAVLASLWSVADASTAALMQEFYATLGLEEGSNAVALSHAQRMLLHSQITPQNADVDRVKRGKVLSTASETNTWTPTNTNSWSHPFYWAPFILMGNW